MAADSVTYGGGILDGVVATIVSNKDNVEAVLPKVRPAEAEAGIVSTTDAAADAAGEGVRLVRPRPRRPGHPAGGRIRARSVGSLRPGTELGAAKKAGDLPPPAVLRAHATPPDPRPTGSRRDRACTADTGRIPGSSGPVLYSRIRSGDPALDAASAGFPRSRCGDRSRFVSWVPP